MSAIQLAQRLGALRCTRWTSTRASWCWPRASVRSLWTPCQVDPVANGAPADKWPGVDVALELIGLPVTMRQAVQVLAVQGRAALAGITRKPFEVDSYQVIRPRGGDRRRLRPPVAGVPAAHRLRPSRGAEPLPYRTEPCPSRQANQRHTRRARSLGRGSPYSDRAVASRSTYARPARRRRQSKPRFSAVAAVALGSSVLSGGRGSLPAPPRAVAPARAWSAAGRCCAWLMARLALSTVKVAWFAGNGFSLPAVTRRAVLVASPSIGCGIVARGRAPPSSRRRFGVVPAVAPLCAG